MKLTKEYLKQVIQEELIKEMDGDAPESYMGGNIGMEPPKEHPVDQHGYEGRMVKQNLFKIMEHAKALHGLIADDEDLEPWVEEKIAVAASMMESVGHYLKYEKVRGD
jgi:hypothetical protein